LREIGVTSWRKKMSTGIFPSGNRVVVKPDDIETTTAGGIFIPETEAQKHAHAQSTGRLMAVGPDAWKHTTKTVERVIDGQWKPVERIITGYSEPFAEVGERVAFAKYGGLQVEGEDGLTYRILNDEDITARVSDEVNFTDLKSRKRVGVA
jgi:chaperonin GroES